MAVDKRSATVCLLDDDDAMLKSTQRLLSGEGWRVQTFLDPHEFLAYSETYKPGVVVLDIYMPAMDGRKVQQQLRRISPSTRVIILTSSDDPSIRDQALAEGASAVFVKPAPNDDFLAAVEAAFM
jgi:FixJ family two-component response regulator